jgi:hypothetical protein
MRSCNINSLAVEVLIVRYYWSEIDVLGIILVTIAIVVSISAISSIYFRRDNAANWFVVISIVWFGIILYYSLDLGNHAVAIALQ